MKFTKMSTNPSDYVVLDLETNGLKSKEHDLLSISIYLPDKGIEYERFLPLELNEYVPYDITKINGITDSILKDKKPLTQEEVDDLITDYDINSRIVLHYGNLDEMFLRAYFKRHKLEGIEKFNFFNFKHLLCGKWSNRIDLSKDNLCNMFGIKGVTETHNGINDCKLEWNLFRKLNGIPMIIDTDFSGTYYYRASKEYIIPVSKIKFNHNLKKYTNIPKLKIKSKDLFNYSITNLEFKNSYRIYGLQFERIICRLLNAQFIDNKEFLINNKKHLELIKFTSNFEVSEIPIQFDSEDIAYTTPKYIKNQEIFEDLLKDIETSNETFKILKTKLSPLIDYINNNIITCENIYSQELVINKEYDVLALCDISTENEVIEIKSDWLGEDEKKYLDRIKEQLFIEANGRKCYLLLVTSSENADKVFKLKEVSFDLDVQTTSSYEIAKQKAKEKIEKNLKSQNISLVNYINSKEKVTVKCNKCGNIWDIAYITAWSSAQIKCNNCAKQEEKVTKHKDKTTNQKCKRTNHKEKATIPKNKTTVINKPSSIRNNSIINRANNYAEKAKERSNGLLYVDSNDYKGSKENVRVKCLKCGSIWNPRADHLLARCWCPQCKYLRK